MPDLIEIDEILALGGFVGAMVLVVLLCVIKGNVYRDRALLLHGAASMMGVLTVQAAAGRHPFLPHAVVLLLMAFSAAQLRDLMAHAGALRRWTRWLLGFGVFGLPVLAGLALKSTWALVAGLFVWSVMVGVTVVRGWRQSRPWVWALGPGLAALASAGLSLTVFTVLQLPQAALTVAGLLTLWSAGVYLATTWRGRVLGEARARVDARNTIDPQSGLSMPMVLTERLNAARTMMQRYGHPSVLLLVHIDNLRKLTEEFGPDCAEGVVLVAANRVREAVREGDVAARITQSRIAVLAEGLSVAEAASNVASRILVAGLKEPLPQYPSEFLHFRIAMAPVPPEDFPLKVLLQRLDARLEQELNPPSERRIVNLSREEIAAV